MPGEEIIAGAKTAVKLAPLLKKANKWINAVDLFGLNAQKYAGKFIRYHKDLKVLGMSKPCSLLDIFVKVNVLEKITSRIRFTVEDLEKFEKSFSAREIGKTIKEGIDGLKIANEVMDLMVLGKPGGGKTTLLKYIGLQTIMGQFDRTRIPVFVSLNALANSEKTLLQYLPGEFDDLDFPNADNFIKKQLKDGNLLLLLDGLDEVGRDKIDKVHDDIVNFVKKYDTNQFIISCRTAAYNMSFERFTDVELADFSIDQIKNFIGNWFNHDEEKAKICFDKLNKNKGTLELGKTPLLLTLLCMTFNETLEFPENRSELYEDALEVLLRKWDNSRKISRGEIYRNLSHRRKEELLSQIAESTFQEKKYFIKQKELVQKIGDFIKNLPEQQTDDIISDSTAVLKSIEAQHGILVERAHNIYSFSHLTFQEYLTARYVENNLATGSLDDLMNHLTDSRWREVFLLCAEMLPKASANNFLSRMKEKTDAMIQDDGLKKLLSWTRDKAKSAKAKRIPAAIRIFYIRTVYVENSDRIRAFAHALDRTSDLSLSFDHDRTRDLILTLSLASDLILSLDHTLDRALDLDLDLDRALVLSRDLARDRALDLSRNRARDFARDFARDLSLDLDRNRALDLSRTFSLDLDFDISRDLALGRARALSLTRDFDLDLDLDRALTLTLTLARKIKSISLVKSLNELIDQIPSESTSKDYLFQWHEKLRQVMIKKRNIGHDFDLNAKQVKCLYNYLFANKLIVDCLNSRCLIDKSLREEIMDTILIPPNLP